MVVRTGKHDRRKKAEEAVALAWTAAWADQTVVEQAPGSGTGVAHSSEDVESQVADGKEELVAAEEYRAT